MATPEEAFGQAEEKMKKTIQALEREMATIRTGRASPAILDRVQVDYYGVPTPVRQTANVKVPDAKTIVIEPYERKMLEVIAKAIQKSDLGINPTNDGAVIRLILPPLSEERRRELVKVVKKTCEESKVAIRNERRDALETVKKMEKQGLPADAIKKSQEKLQKLTDRYIQDIDRHGEHKEAEIMEV